MSAPASTAATLRERAVRFGANGTSVGIITEPANPNPELPAFVFLNAGLTHRVGPNGLYVRLARRLAASGFTSIRFDFSGIGDSGPRTDDLPLGKAVVVETQDALEEVTRLHGIRRFVLIGICSGATISYLTAREDERVVGAVLINAQGHLHGTDPDMGTFLRDKTVSHHSFRIALKSSFRSKNWRKAFAGRLDPKHILQMVVGSTLSAFKSGKGKQQTLKVHDPVADMKSLTSRGVRLFHLYSEGDEGLDYFQVVVGKRLGELDSDPNADYEVVRGANHVFTLLWSQDVLLDSVERWAHRYAGDPS